MTDNNSYRASLRRRSVSETDTEYAPPDRAKSNPNLSISGFIDESLFAGPGTCLQSQREGIESRVNKIASRLQSFKLKIWTWVDKMKN